MQAQAFMHTVHGTEIMRCIAHLDIQPHRRFVQDDVVLSQREVMHQVGRGDHVHRVFPQQGALLVEAADTDKRLLEQIILKVEDLACISGHSVWYHVTDTDAKILLWEHDEW